MLKFSKIFCVLFLLSFQLLGGPSLTRRAAEPPLHKPLPHIWVSFDNQVSGEILEIFSAELVIFNRRNGHKHVETLNTLPHRGDLSHYTIIEPRLGISKSNPECGSKFFVGLKLDFENQNRDQQEPEILSIDFGFDAKMLKICRTTLFIKIVLEKDPETKGGLRAAIKVL